MTRLPLGGSRRKPTTGLMLGALLVALAAPGAATEKQYSPGATDAAIKIGQTIAYSGPASSFGAIGRTAAAYYRMINEQGGVNGRKIVFLSLDDGYSPPKTVEQTRRLVEQEQVLAIFGMLGTPTNAAVQRYLNEHKMPQLFVFSGVTRFRDPQNYPWTMGGDLSFANETRAFARHIVQTVPDAKIAVLYQNDDMGKDHLVGLRAALGDKAARMIVKEVSYEATDATIESQIVALQASGANVLVDAALPKFTAQAIRKAHDIGWKPLHVIAYPAASIPATLLPAGLEESIGVITAEFLKDPGDPSWAADPEIAAYRSFLRTYNRDADPNERANVLGYYHAALVVHLLKQCGDDLTRENLLYRATHLHDVHIPLLLPGIVISTSPSDYSPIKQLRLQQFDGARWVPLGGIVSD
jgi:branched-chain amino acid transport system substrate-binding protein